MARADRIRASKALRERAAGKSWRLVAAATGYATRDSARVAAEREMRRREEGRRAKAVFQ